MSKEQGLPLELVDINEVIVFSNSLLNLAQQPAEFRKAVDLINKLRNFIPKLDLASLKDSEYKATILHLAACYNNKDLVDYILDNNLIDIDAPMGNGYNLPPIASAISSLSFPIIQTSLREKLSLTIKEVIFS